ncbi:MAG TPA: Crp/Fnr family transcriptional regulator [Acetobacteraceae bacterium]|nr:Crp/Fnr family transcriptional regulator [Acetobacteraceae bacterium]
MPRSVTARVEPKGRRPRIVARAFCATEGRCPPLGNLLSPAEQRELARIATLLEYQAGGVAILSEGEDAHFLYLIDDGIVRLSRHLPDGARQVLGFMWPGDLFGLAEEGRYINSAECLTPAAIFRFPLDRLRSMLLNEPLLQLHMLAKAVHELRNAQRQIIVLGRLNSPRRLASLLLDSRQHAAFFDSRTRILRLPMSRFDIADYLGITPESVARAFVALEREGLARRLSPRSVELLDADRLARFVRGGPPR